MPHQSADDVDARPDIRISLLPLSAWKVVVAVATRHPAALVGVSVSGSFVSLFVIRRRDINGRHLLEPVVEVRLGVVIFEADVVLTAAELFFVKGV